MAVSQAGPAQAGPPYPIKKDFKFDAASKFGLIIVQLEPQRVVPDYTLGIYQFSLADRKWTYGPLKGWSRFGKIGGNPSAPAYAITAVEPGGTYAVNGLTVQGWWRACFNGGTKAFEVKPGTVTFIGAVDPRLSINQIITGLPGKTPAGKVQDLFDSPRLAIVPATDMPNSAQALADYLKANYPNITAPIETPALVDTTFDKTKTLIAGTICERY